MPSYETASLSFRSLPVKPKRRRNGSIAGSGSIGQLREELQRRLARLDELTGGRRPTTPNATRSS